MPTTSAEPTTKRSQAANGRAPTDPVGRYIKRRVTAAATSDGPNETFMRTVQNPIWDFLCDHYFRRLMAAPGLGDYFKAMGVIPASRRGVTAALEAGHDVVIWPGGEQDAMRNWRKRDRAVLAGRKGFVRQAIRSGVPIVPVATVGGHDTVFVLSEGRFLARWTGLGKRLRGATMPIIAGFPFPLAVEILPAHIPLPAKIRTELLDPIIVDDDPERAGDDAYVNSVYLQVEGAIQAGMDRLAKRRSFPIFG